MTENQIPADVMEAARRARKKFADEAMNLPVWDGTDLIAAHAILAERERCAKIIDDNQEIVHMKSNARVVSPRTPGSLTGIAYAAAIRNPAP